MFAGIDIYLSVPRLSVCKCDFVGKFREIIIILFFILCTCNKEVFQGLYKLKVVRQSVLSGFGCKKLTF